MRLVLARFTALRSVRAGSTSEAEIPYTFLSNLLGGVDRSRPIYALEPGVLWEGINCHLTRGGDVEKRKAFVEFAQLPAGTFGFERASGDLYVFGSQAPPAMPAGVLYQQLQHPDGFAMTKLLSTDVYGGEVYAAAQFADGAVLHFYDGALVADWINGVVRASMVNIAGIVSHLAGLVSDATFTVTTTPTEVVIEHNTENVAFTLTASAVNVTGGNNDQTAVSALVTAAGVGVKEKRKITIGGTFEVGDRFGYTLAGTNYGAVATPTPVGTVVKTHGRKVYAGSARLLNFSGADTAVGWDRDDDPGAGFEDVSTHESDLETVTALGKFLGFLAVLSENAIQVWDVRPDEAENNLVQHIGETGTRARKSVRNFGQLDMFYLSDSGIRSLRARAQNQLAGVNDVGTPIDTLVQEQAAALADELFEESPSIVDPVDSRFWQAVGDKIFVFTYFPTKKVSGWSWYEPGFSATDLVALNRRVYARAGDKIYVYGGVGGDIYDSSKVTATLPFLHANKPGTFKNLSGIDIAATGRWEVDLLVDPNELANVVHFGHLDGVSFGEEDIAGLGRATHVAPRFIHEEAGPASLSGTAFYYTQGDSES